MVMNKLLSRNDETVEILDFRNNEIVDLFKTFSIDEALLKLKDKRSEDNYLGVAKPFKLITIPGQKEIDYLVKGNFSANNNWYIWEKLLSESNLNLEIIVLLTGNLPEYSVSRNKLFLPEFLTEKRIRILWVSSYRGNFWGSESQNYSSALLKTYENTEQANFEALLKPLTVLEVFNNIFLLSQPGEIYNPGLRQAAFGKGYKKESKDALYEVTHQITGIENVINSGNTSQLELQLDENFKGNLKPQAPIFKQGIFSELNSIGTQSIGMSRLFGLTNNLVSKDQIPSFGKRLEKSYKEYVDNISNYLYAIYKSKNKVENLINSIDATDGINEDEFIKLTENEIDITTSKSTVDIQQRPINLATKLFSNILEGINGGHNIVEFKILLRKLIKQADPNSPEESSKKLNSIWKELENEESFLNLEDNKDEFQKYVKKRFRGKYLKSLLNFPWSILDKKKILGAILSVITVLLSLFWFITTFIAGEPGDEPVFRSSGFEKLDLFVTDLFRNTNWLDVLTPLLIGAFVIWFLLFLCARYLIHSIERLGRELLIDEMPEIILNTKVFLWSTLINDWILAKDRKELILYLESILEVLDGIQHLLSEKFLKVEYDKESIFQNRYLDPNPVLEINLNSVSENGVYKDFEGTVGILCSDIVFLLEQSFDQEWMKIRGAIGRNDVPERIVKNFKKELENYEARLTHNSILENKVALDIVGYEKRQEVAKNLWSEGDYPREQVLDLMNLEQTAELVHFLNPNEVSLLNSRSEGLVFFRFAPIVLDLPAYQNFIRTKESKVAGVMRLVPMAIQLEYIRSQNSDFDEVRVN
jgi:hypothetical protein